MQITTIGLDLAKNWFQVHGVDADGKAVVRRKLRRSEVIKFFKPLSPCLIGIEACATAHHWARELTALGHQVKLMPPAGPQANQGRSDGAGQQDRTDRLGGDDAQRWLPRQCDPRAGSVKSPPARSECEGEERHDGERSSRGSGRTT